MKRIATGERPDWVRKLEDLDFTIHHMYGELYWDERNAYQFTLAEIEDGLEDPTNEILQLCYKAVDRICADPALMTRMAIPAEFQAAVSRSWKWSDRDIYGRFDLRYDGKGPAKLFEFNADTPTSLFESAVIQWEWLQDMKRLGRLSADADQFNSIHEKLIGAFQYFKNASDSGVFHFGCITDNEEDYLTTKYLADVAFQAGFEVVVLDMEEIGIDPENWFTDLEDRRMENLFKLYPLEFMVHEEFGAHLISTPTKIHEPLWKMTLSNKGLLAVLWEMAPNHPNLLPAYFADDPQALRLENAVRKPLLSREGANVTLTSGETIIAVDGEYGAEGYIVQETCLLPQFGEDYAVIGSWVVAGEACGICIREDKSPITQNLSRFVPHFIMD
ncbi:glutathionylspermidine synthase family protein [Rhizobium sp. BK379]|uniref:glutathionylspermidine synthase family protein n=1 Tax=Rhizobium sp. BK379 TaxID=2587059 RepID=UPI00161EB2E3|nr:glutathionylspermidine synthase family protein [Rhizobium sp. BK379]MBB3440582.1 glutathionylspermidine synthase [Rhizobium sp. BK379]